MSPEQFMSLRRAWGRARQAAPSHGRLTFGELGILCRVALSDAPLRPSDLANGQNMSRAATTHRLDRLRSLGLVSLAGRDDDRRAYDVLLTDAGSKRALECVSLLRSKTDVHDPRRRSEAGSLMRDVWAASTVPCDGAGLVLMAACGGDESMTSTARLTGLLQPTVTMAARRLEERGLLKAPDKIGPWVRHGLVPTEEGRAANDATLGAVRSLKVACGPYRAHQGAEEGA